MKLVTRKITKKGQVTIPVVIRRMFNISINKKVDFIIENGKVELRPSAYSLKKNFGAIKPLNKPENFKKLRKTALNGKTTKK